MRFPSPYELKAPPGAEGWQRLYPYYLVFQDKLKKQGRGKILVLRQPALAEPVQAVRRRHGRVRGQVPRPVQHPPLSGSAGQRRRLPHPQWLLLHEPGGGRAGADRRPRAAIHGARRLSISRTGTACWRTGTRRSAPTSPISKRSTFEKLPDVVPLDWVTGGVGLDNTYALMETYDRAIQLLYKTWQYHFEFLNLGYAAYLDFFGFLKSQFPTIPDQAIAKMVQGVDVDLFRPDDELKKLAKLAVKLGVRRCAEDRIGRRRRSPRSANMPNGRQWLAAWKAAQDPWFNFTSGNGFYSTDKYWIEHLDIPLGYIRDYIVRVEKGEEIDRPTAKIAAERDRITSEYAELLDADARAAFEGKLGLARTVFPYVENHNFYIEHWSMGVFWRKMRGLSRMLHEAGFWQGPDDMFYLDRQEVRDALFDYGNAWAVGTDADRPGLLAGRDRQAQEDHGRARDTGAAAGAERSRPSDHRAVHHHAVGHHHRERRPLAQRRRRQVETDRHGGLARHGRRAGARRPIGRRARPDQAGRNPGRRRSRRRAGRRYSARSRPPSPTSAA